MLQLFLLVILSPTKHFQPMARLDFWFLPKEKNDTSWKRSKGEKVGINEKHECPKRNCEGNPFKRCWCASVWVEELKTRGHLQSTIAWQKLQSHSVNLVSLAYHSFHFFICDVLVNQSSPKLTLHFWIVCGEGPRQVSTDVDEAQSHCGMSGQWKICQISSASVKRLILLSLLTVWWSEWLKSEGASPG